MCFKSEKAEKRKKLIKQPQNTFHRIIYFHCWSSNFEKDKYSEGKKKVLNEKKCLEKCFGKNYGDVIELRRA